MAKNTSEFPKSPDFPQSADEFSQSRDFEKTVFATKQPAPTKKTSPVIDSNAKVVYLVNPHRADFMQPSAFYKLYSKALFNSLIKNGLPKLAEENKELATALFLFFKGVRHPQLEKIPRTSLAEKGSINETQSVMMALEKSEGELFNIYNRQNYDPDLATALIKDYQHGPTIERTGQQQNVVLVNQDEEYYPVQPFISQNPIVNFVQDKAGNFAKDQLKKFAENAVKKATGKLPKEILEQAAKSIGKKAVSTGAKAVGTAAVEATAATTIAGAEVAAGPPGWVLIAAEAVLMAGQLIASVAKKVISSLLITLTGEKDKGKQAAVVLLMLSGAGFLLGGYVVGFASLGGGLFVAMTSDGRFQIIRRFTIAMGAALTGILTFLLMVLAVLLYIFFVPLLIAFALIIVINGGAYVVPPNPSRVQPYFEQQQNFGIEKKVDKPKVPNGTNTVAYTIRIWAKIGCITVVTAQNNYEIFVKTGASAITPPSPPNGGVDALVGKVICPSDNGFNGYSFTYNLTIGPTIVDAVLNDKITVTIKTPDGGTETANASASVCVGNCPEDCPSGWPVYPPNGGTVVQGPYGSGTHSQVEAIDITDAVSSQNYMGSEVMATHAGLACVSSGSNGVYGQYVYIIGKCNGTDFASVYGHLEKGSAMIPSGTHVSKGQLIGLGDDTGGWNFPHLHYEFSIPYSTSSCGGFGSGAWTATNRGPIIMAPPFLPELVPLYCYNSGGRPCNVNY